MGGAIIELPMRLEDKPAGEMLVSLLAGGKDLLGFYRMKLLAGRNLTDGDSLREFVINETYCKALGFRSPEEATGRLINFQGKAYPVVGVAADFHSASFREPIRPLAIGHVPGLEQSLGIRLKMKDNKGTLARLGQAWKEMFPKENFSYSWLDESIASLYRRDRQVERMMTVAMAAAIFIACMGVLGLVLFMAERRGREISIRKVLGANVTTIAWMLSRDLFILMGIALLIASPVAWYGLNRWLRDFAYRTAVSWTLFPAAGLMALLIVMCTISVQVIRAAVANPAQRLRAE